MAHNARSLTPPEAPQRPVTIRTHDDVRVDEFFWLRERDNPEVLQYLAAENLHTAAATAHTQPLQEILYQETVGRIRETDESARLPEGDYWYYERTEAGKAYPVLCRRGRDAGAGEELLLDLNELAMGHAFCHLGEWRVSPDQKLLAYCLDLHGNEAFYVYVKRLDSGELLPERMGNAYYGLEWAADSQHLFYTQLGPAHRPQSIWRHRLGDDPAGDVCVFHEPDVRFFAGLEKTANGESVLITADSNTTSEVWFVPAGEPLAAPQVIVPRQPHHEYSVAQCDAFFLVRTNLNAPNFRVVAAPVAAPGPQHWQEVIPHDPEFLIERLMAFAGYLVLFGHAAGLPRIRVLHLGPAGTESAAQAITLLEQHDVAFPEPSYTCSLERKARFAEPLLYFVYSSLITPATVYAYDLRARTRTVVKQEEIKGYDPTDYVVERRWAQAPDGVQVPLSLAYRRNLPHDGSNPAFLTGYGAYGSSMEPGFQPARVSLLTRGFVVAVAHIRGGSELGRSWYDDGKLLHKHNSFTDFIACAEALITGGLTNPAKLLIRGRSAGGLLMGAVTNLRPDLFAAVIAGVPFMDVINTMLDASIPLTAMEYEEWGDPNDPAQYAYMRSYSPYDNLAARTYPRLLVTGGLHDPRVQYWEPAKYVARLRALQAQHTGPNNPVLLRTNMTVGHGGPTGRYENLRETAFEVAFLLDAVGITQ